MQMAKTQEINLLLQEHQIMILKMLFKQLKSKDSLPKTASNDWRSSKQYIVEVLQAVISL